MEYRDTYLSRFEEFEFGVQLKVFLKGFVSLVVRGAEYGVHLPRYHTLDIPHPSIVMKQFHILAIWFLPFLWQ